MKHPSASAVLKVMSPLSVFASNATDARTGRNTSANTAAMSDDFCSRRASASTGEHERRRARVAAGSRSREIDSRSLGVELIAGAGARLFRELGAEKCGDVADELEHRAIRDPMERDGVDRLAHDP